MEVGRGQWGDQSGGCCQGEKQMTREREWGIDNYNDSSAVFPLPSPFTT